MTRAGFAWLLLLVGLLPQAAGSASISGIVTDDQQPPRPVRRAVVTLTGAGLRPNRGAITDDDGAFVLRNLPPGRFTLAAERGGFVSGVYGAKRPGRQGTDLTITDGQQLTDVRLRIWRGAVLSGTVRDESGEPLPNASVAAVPMRAVTPAVVSLSNNNQAMTNDLGEFRLFGLEPGTYVVRATRSQFRPGPPDIAMSDAEVDAKLAALAARTRTPGPTSAPRPADRVEASGTLVSEAPIYFPGTASPTDATTITLAAGEERSGLDFRVERIRTPAVRGKVAGADGAPAANAYVLVAVNAGPVQFPGAVSEPATTSSQPDGSFTFASIAPGNYRLLARVAIPQTSGAAATSSFWWAAMPVSPAGPDLDLGTLTLQPGMTLSGRVAFDSAATIARPDVSQLRVQLRGTLIGEAAGTRAGAGPNPRVLQPAQVRADGTFSVPDLVPDEYRLGLTGAGLGDSGWWLRSALWNGRELLDAPVPVAARQDITGVTLVLSDRHTEVSGTLSTTGGAAMSNVFVLAYPAGAALRTPRSRRVQAVRSDSSGRFVIKNLPGGDYLLCALTDVEDGEWDDAGFLDPLVASSVKITLADGEKKIQNLRAGGG